MFKCPYCEFSGKRSEVHHHLADDLEDDPEPQRDEGRDGRDHPEHQDADLVARVLDQVGAEHAGDRARRAERRDDRVGVEQNVGGRGGEPADEVEDGELDVAEQVLDLIAEDPEVEHVARDVHQRPVHEHRRQERELDRHRPRVVVDRHGLAAQVDAHGSRQVLVVQDLEGDRGPGVRERVAGRRLEQVHEHVQADQAVHDEGCRVPSRVVVAEWKQHLSSSVAPGRYGPQRTRVPWGIVSRSRARRSNHPSVVYHAGLRNSFGLAA